MKNIEIIKLLLANENIDVNKKSKIILTFDLEEKTQLSEDIKIEIPPIYLATQKENYEIIKLLLMNDKIDPNMRYEHTLFGTDAADRWAKCNKKTSLHFAIEKGNIELINLLLTNEKIDVNRRSKTGDCVTNGDGEWIDETPLNNAVQNNNIEIVKLLLMNDKIDVNKANCYFFDKDFDLYSYKVSNYAEYIDQITRQLFQ